MAKLCGAAAIVMAVMAAMMGCASITDAAVSTPPAKTVYGQGQELDVAGLVVTTTDSKGKVKQERITGTTRITGFDTHRPGTQTLFISVGFTGKVKATFEVRVMPLESIVISAQPAKIKYKQGEDFDAAGLAIRGRWAEIGEGDISASNYTVSGYDKSKAGYQTVTIASEGKTAGFSVSVVPLTSVAIAAPPAKIKYKQGEDFDPTGLKVRGTWAGIGESDIPASNYTVSGYDKNKFGNQTVIVTSEGKTAAINVTVMQLVALSVTAQPSKIKYATGEALDLNGLVLNGTYMDGNTPTQSAINPANAAVSGFDSSFVGNQKVTLAIGAISTSFTVTVEQAAAPVAPPPVAAAPPPAPAPAAAPAPAPSGTLTWTAVSNSSFDSYEIHDIAYGGGKFVAVGRDGRMATSGDGVTWTRVPGYPFRFAIVRSIIPYGDGKFCAGGIDGKLAISSDGISWPDAKEFSEPGSTNLRNIYGLAYGGGKLVAVGRFGTIATSGDGNGFTLVPGRPAGSDDIYSITYGNGKFVAGGEKGQIATSADGVSWTVAAGSPFKFGIYDITYAAGKFVAVGAGGQIAISGDGVTWTAVADSTFGSGLIIRGIAYGGGKFVVGGDDGKMAISSDGVTWTALSNPVFNNTDNINSISYGDGKFVAVGFKGKIAYSK